MVRQRVSKSQCIEDVERKHELSASAEGNGERLENGSTTRTWIGPLKIFDRAVSLDPSFAPAYCNRGSAWVMRGMVDKAFSDYNRALEYRS